MRRAVSLLFALFSSATMSIEDAESGYIAQLPMDGGSSITRNNTRRSPHQRTNILDSLKV